MGQIACGPYTHEVRTLLFLVIAAGCGPAPVPPDERQPPDPVRTGGDEEPPEDVPNPRALSAGATFADLVGAVRALDDHGNGDATAECLLRGEGPYRLEADLAVAVRPLPTPRSLHEEVSQTGPLRILTRWGQAGEGRTALAGLTSTPPPSAGAWLAIVVAADGIGLRTTDGSTSAGPFALGELGARLTALGATSAPVFVTADPETTLARLREVLRVVQASGRPIALAVALTDGIPVPDPPSRGEVETGLCTSAPAAPEGASGDMEPTAAREALAPASDGIAACMATASPESAGGGRVAVRFVVGEGGRVVHACATHDEIGDSGLRACVLDVVRALRFPDPGGLVHLAVPFVLAPDRGSVQRALCD